MSRLESGPQFEPQIEENKEITSEEKPELSPEELELKKEGEDREIAGEIIKHPVVQRGSEIYKIFSDIYFQGEDVLKIKKIKKEDIKQRADKILGEDFIYQDILKLERPLEGEDFIKYIISGIKKEQFDELKKAKKEGNFDEILAGILINRQVERGIKESEEKEIFAQRAGKMWVEIIGNECRTHLPRIAQDWRKTLVGIEESYKELAKLLQTDKRFENVKKLEEISWLLGREKAVRGSGKETGWHYYKEEEIAKMEGYEDMQKTGVKASPKLFKKYLFEGNEKMPKIGGRWINREDFISKYLKESEEKQGEEKEQTQEEIREILEKALSEKSHVDLLIDGREAPDLIVEEIREDYLIMTYLNDKGEMGEGIPLNFSSIKRAKLTKKNGRSITLMREDQ